MTGGSNTRGWILNRSQPNSCRKWNFKEKTLIHTLTAIFYLVIALILREPRETITMTISDRRDGSRTIIHFCDIVVANWFKCSRIRS